MGLIRKNPRDYRGLYSRVMDIPELSVSAEDSQAAALMYELADIKRENLQGLSPEKLRELADQNEVDEFAELLRTGRAKFASEAEKRYVKQQDRQIKDLRETLADVEAANKEDMTYLNRIAGKEFMDAFDRAVKLKEGIRRQSDKLDRAIRRNTPDAAKAARALQGLQSSYKAAEAELAALARAHKLEIDVREALADQRVTEALAAQRGVLKSEAARAVSAQAAADEAAAQACTKRTPMAKESSLRAAKCERGLACAAGRQAGYALRPGVCGESA